MAGGAKQFFTIGGQGMKTNHYARMVDAGKFTKKTRKVKPISTKIETPETY